MAPNKDSTTKTVGVALAVCLVCSVLVSMSVVMLRKTQNLNKKLEKIVNILKVSHLLTDNMDPYKTFKDKIVAQVIDLKSGQVIPEGKYDKKINPEEFDIAKMVNDPKLSQLLPSQIDLAGVKRIPLYMPVYLVKAENGYKTVIFPFFGKGLWSTMYGFLSMDAKDWKTIQGITFYEHGETPGLGGEIENPRWQKLWEGKIAYDDQGQIAVQVIKGTAKEKNQIDGLSGATLTTRGVDNTIHFWLGENGFGPYIKKMAGRK